ncbi:MAG: hypothetical protein J5J06_15215 [Phycisphaerae bacterium]|nr:hypothetical protein [Phycisphaerae bacterium]
MRAMMIGLLLLVPLGIAGFVSYRMSRAEPTIHQEVARMGYTPVFPPTTFITPGTIALVRSDVPQTLELVCGQRGALGHNVAGSYRESRTISAQSQQMLSGSLSVSSSQLQDLSSRSSVAGIQRITLQLTNVRIVELADEDVFRLADQQSEQCKQAVAFRRSQGERVTMIKSALIADVEYLVDLSQHGSADATATALQAMAVQLHASLEKQSSDRLVGRDLIWGIRDDATLIEYLSGLSPTGDASAQPLLSPDDIVRDIITPLHIRWSIAPLQQPSRMSCWSTVATMMLTWREQRSLSINYAMESLGPQWKQLHTADRGLPPELISELAAAMQLTVHAPQTFHPRAYLRMLIDHGPIWINTTVPGSMRSHARLLIGASSASNGHDDLLMEFIDPAVGTIRIEDFATFLASYEKEAQAIVDTGRPEPLRTQVLHFAQFAE